MQVGHNLQIHCEGCKAAILFSVLDPEEFNGGISCPTCKMKYTFDDKTLLRHLQQFEALCRQIYASQEILGGTSIAIDVGSHHVKVPFNILLTRLTSVIDLDIGGRKFSVAFRVDPLKDVPKAHMDK